MSNDVDDDRSYSEVGHYIIEEYQPWWLEKTIGITDLSVCTICMDLFVNTVQVRRTRNSNARSQKY